MTNLLNKLKILHKWLQHGVGHLPNDLDWDPQVSDQLEPTMFDPYDLQQTYDTFDGKRNAGCEEGKNMAEIDKIHDKMIDQNFEKMEKQFIRKSIKQRRNKLKKFKINPKKIKAACLIVMMMIQNLYEIGYMNSVHDQEIHSKLNVEESRQNSRQVRPENEGNFPLSSRGVLPVVSAASCGEYSSTAVESGTSFEKNSFDCDEIEVTLNYDWGYYKDDGSGVQVWNNLPNPDPMNPINNIDSVIYQTRFNKGIQPECPDRLTYILDDGSKCFNYFNDNWIQNNENTPCVVQKTSSRFEASWSADFSEPIYVTKVEILAHNANMNSETYSKFASWGSNIEAFVGDPGSQTIRCGNTRDTISDIAYDGEPIMDWQKIYCTTPEAPLASSIKLQRNAEVSGTSDDDYYLAFCGVKVYGRRASSLCEDDTLISSIFTPTSEQTTSSSCQIDKFEVSKYEGCFEESAFSGPGIAHFSDFWDYVASLDVDPSGDRNFDSIRSDQKIDLMLMTNGALEFDSNCHGKSVRYRHDVDSCSPKFTGNGFKPDNSYLAWQQSSSCNTAQVFEIEWVDQLMVSQLKFGRANGNTDSLVEEVVLKYRDKDYQWQDYNGGLAFSTNISSTTAESTLDISTPFLARAINIQFTPTFVSSCQYTFRFTFAFTQLPSISLSTELIRMDYGVLFCGKNQQGGANLQVCSCNPGSNVFYGEQQGDGVSTKYSYLIDYIVGKNYYQAQFLDEADYLYSNGNYQGDHMHQLQWTSNFKTKQMGSSGWLDCKDAEFAPDPQPGVYTECYCQGTNKYNSITGMHLSGQGQLNSISGGQIASSANFDTSSSYDTNSGGTCDEVLLLKIESQYRMQIPLLGGKTVSKILFSKLKSTNLLKSQNEEYGNRALTHLGAIFTFDYGDQVVDCNVYPEVAPYEYTQTQNAYVSLNNLIKYTGKTLQECKDICDADSLCLAFEFYAFYHPDYDAADWPSGSCMGKSTTTPLIECEVNGGACHNKDLYVKGASTTSGTVSNITIPCNAYPSVASKTSGQQYERIIKFGGIFQVLSAVHWGNYAADYWIQYKLWYTFDMTTWTEYGVIQTGLTLNDPDEHEVLLNNLVAIGVKMTWEDSDADCNNLCQGEFDFKLEHIYEQGFVENFRISMKDMTTNAMTDYSGVTGLTASDDGDVTKVIDLTNFKTEILELYVTPTVMSETSSSGVNYGTKHKCYYGARYDIQVQKDTDTGFETLPILLGPDQYVSSIADCLTLATNYGGLRYAGVIDGGVCLGSKWYPEQHSPVYTASSETYGYVYRYPYTRTGFCDLTCKSGEQCGGSTAISVYTLPGEEEWKDMGCYKDSLISLDPDLFDGDGIKKSDVTLEECQSYALANNYLYIFIANEKCKFLNDINWVPRDQRSTCAISCTPGLSGTCTFSQIWSTGFEIYKRNNWFQRKLIQSQYKCLKLNPYAQFSKLKQIPTYYPYQIGVGTSGSDPYHTLWLGAPFGSRDKCIGEALHANNGAKYAYVNKNSCVASTSYYEDGEWLYAYPSGGSMWGHHRISKEAISSYNGGCASTCLTGEQCGDASGVGNSYSLTSTQWTGGAISENNLDAGVQDMVPWEILNSFSIYQNATSGNQDATTSYLRAIVPLEAQSNVFIKYSSNDDTTGAFGWSQQYSFSISTIAVESSVSAITVPIEVGHYNTFSDAQPQEIISYEDLIGTNPYTVLTFKPAPQGTNRAPRFKLVAKYNERILRYVQMDYEDFSVSQSNTESGLYFDSGQNLMGNFALGLIPTQYTVLVSYHNITDQELFTITPEIKPSTTLTDSIQLIHWKDTSLARTDLVSYLTLWSPVAETISPSTFRDGAQSIEWEQYTTTFWSESSGSFISDSAQSLSSQNIQDDTTTMTLSATLDANVGVDHTFWAKVRKNPVYPYSSCKKESDSAYSDDQIWCKDETENAADLSYPNGIKDSHIKCDAGNIVHFAAGGEGITEYFQREWEAGSVGDGTDCPSTVLFGQNLNPTNALSSYEADPSGTTVCSPNNFDDAIPPPCSPINTSGNYYRGCICQKINDSYELWIKFTIKSFSLTLAPTAKIPLEIYIGHLNQISDQSEQIVISEDDLKKLYIFNPVDSSGFSAVQYLQDVETGLESTTLIYQQNNNIVRDIGSYSSGIISSYKFWMRDETLSPALTIDITKEFKCVYNEAPIGDSYVMQMYIGDTRDPCQTFEPSTLLAWSPLEDIQDASFTVDFQSCSKADGSMTPNTDVTLTNGKLCVPTSFTESEEYYFWAHVVKDTQYELFLQYKINVISQADVVYTTQQDNILRNYIYEDKEPEQFSFEWLENLVTIEKPSYEGVLEYKLSSQLYKKVNGEYKESDHPYVYTQSDTLYLTKNVQYNTDLYLKFEVLYTSLIYYFPIQVTSCNYDDFLTAAPLTVKWDAGVFYGVEYFNSTEISKLFRYEGYTRDCKVQSISLVKDIDGSALDASSGLGIVSYDSIQDFLLIDRTQGTYELNIYAQAQNKANQLAYYPIFVHLLPHTNQAPYFVQELEPFVVEVLWRKQILLETSTLEYESPKIEDLEGDNLLIEFSEIDNEAITIELLEDSFKCYIDENLVSGINQGVIDVTINMLDDGTEPRGIKVYSWQIEIVYNQELTQEQKQALADAELVAEFEAMLEGDEELLLLFPLLNGETPLMRAKRVQAYLKQNKLVGNTFPGVNIAQIEAMNQTPEEEPEEPTMDIEPINALGEVTINFNQDMFIPSNRSEIAYTSIIGFEIVSAIDKSVVEATFVENPEESKQRRQLWQQKRELRLGKIPRAPYLVIEDHDVDYYGSLPFDYNGDSTIEAAEPESEKLRATWHVVSHEPTQLIFKLDFENPEMVTSTSYGPDSLNIPIKNLALFKSAVSGKPILPSTFKNSKPELSSVLPPIISDVEQAEQIDDQATFLGDVTEVVSGSNFIVSMLLGGSMQHLWGMIRIVQMVSLMSLTYVQLPAHAMVFFEVCIMFSSLDIFSGEKLYELIFEFREDEPLNEKFDQLDMGGKNFLMNSGSFFIMATLIVWTFYLKRFINFICSKLARFKIARIVGMYFHPEREQESVMYQAALKLFLESYFDLNIAIFLSCWDFYEVGSIKILFDNFDNSVSSLITIVAALAILVFPFWSYYQILEMVPFAPYQIESKYSELFLEGISTHSRSTLMYNYYFMTRRCLVAFFLVFFHQIPLLQVGSMIFASVIHISYMIYNMPFKNNQDNWIEIGNELTLLTIAHVILGFTNPLHHAIIRASFGWMLIGLTAINIVVNLIIVIIFTSMDTYEFGRLSYKTYNINKQMRNRLFIDNYIHDDIIDKKEIEALRDEFQAFHYCKDWIPERKWCLGNQVDISEFSNEIKYQQYQKQFNFQQRMTMTMVARAQIRAGIRLKNEIVSTIIQEEKLKHRHVIRKRLGLPPLSSFVQEQADNAQKDQNKNEEVKVKEKSLTEEQKLAQKLKKVAKTNKNTDSVYGDEEDGEANDTQDKVIKVKIKHAYGTTNKEQKKLVQKSEKLKMGTIIEDSQENEDESVASVRSEKKEKPKKISINGKKILREQISKINESDTILLIKPSQRSQFVDKFKGFAMNLNFKEISQEGKEQDEEEQIVEMVDLDFMNENDPEEKMKQMEDEIVNHFHKGKDQTLKEMIEDTQSTMIIHDGGQNNEVGALLQWILEIQPLKKLFISEKYSQVGGEKTQGTDRTVCQELTKVFKEAYSFQLSEFPIKKLSIDSSREVLCEKLKIGSGNTISDLFEELVEHVVGELSTKESQLIKPREYLRADADKEAILSKSFTTIFSKLFTGVYYKVISCENHPDKQRQELSTEDQLVLKNKGTLLLSLEKYFGEQTFEDDCTDCDDEQTFTCQNKISFLPPMLVFSVDRFKNGVKNQDRFRYPRILEYLSQFSDKDEDKYELFAVVANKGASLRDSKYVTIVKKASGEEIEFDSSQNESKQLNEGEILKQSKHCEMLIYVKQSIERDENITDDGKDSQE